MHHPWRGGTSGKRTCIRIEQFALLEKVNMIAADVQEAALSSGKASNFMRATSLCVWKSTPHCIFIYTRK
ncbi:hypothetical protein PC118_g17978 [Phytophthora cactorum]|uniref:Uncharacterized protein n=1 Tax=Phytophthora cactorum TaxID=29920 RepID=A0A8T1FEC6_9STRA|nr:hypothetical protein PC118_g17978 [Phytophthora cactorum]